jgi:hypothetical protein
MQCIIIINKEEVLIIIDFRATGNFMCLET